MTDRFAFLDDIEDVLWDSTAQTIDESLQRGESPEHGRIAEQPCAWCGHTWHGLRCQPEIPALVGHPQYGLGVVLVPDPAGCLCADARPALDDTWRPALTRVEQLMRDEGLDGWAAKAEHARTCQCPGHSIRRAMTVTASEMRRLASVAADIGVSSERATDATRQFLHAWTAAPPQPAPPLTPWVKARALTARQTRNTGPNRPTAGHAHRPRRHT